MFILNHKSTNMNVEPSLLLFQQSDSEFSWCCFQEGTKHVLRKLKSFKFALRYSISSMCVRAGDLEEVEQADGCFVR